MGDAYTKGVSVIVQKRWGLPPPARGFTLLEMMMVVALLALLVAIVIPAYQRLRMRSQAGMVKEDLRVIDDAINLYAIEMNKSKGSALSFADLKPYLKDNTALYSTGADMFGNLFGPAFIVNRAPYPPLPTYQALKEVADDSFWSPYATPPP